jgi:CSLREA domain-containing protein
MNRNSLAHTVVKGIRLLAVAALLAGWAVALQPAMPAYAATLTVTTTNDELNSNGQCSLREAITNANNNATTWADCAPVGAYGPDIINLPTGTYILTRVGGDDTNNNGDLDILATGGDLTIQGNGAVSTIIDASGLVFPNRDRVFDINPGGGAITVNISGVTIQNGDETMVGGIYNHPGGTVNISNSTLSTNSGHFCGGIYNLNGTVNISNSTLSGNQAMDNGGGIYNQGGTVNISNSTLSGNTVDGGHGGGIYNDGGTVNISNSTLSGNRTGMDGGGVFNNGTANLSNVTITNNTADNNNDGLGDGGGIYHQAGTVNLKNTIVAGNFDGTPAPGTIHPDISGGVTGNHYNLIGNTTGGTGSAGTGSDIVNPVPGLGGLANNGGATRTHALQVGSPAIDAGNPAGCTDHLNNPITTDQRGYSRSGVFADGDANGTTVCDIGAYEFLRTEPEPKPGPGVVPEASTLILLGSGLAGLGAYARLRWRAKKRE